jgi:hypothetical protein
MNHREDIRRRPDAKTEVASSTTAAEILGSRPPDIRNITDLGRTPGGL